MIHFLPFISLLLKKNKKKDKELSTHNYCYSCGFTKDKLYSFRVNEILCEKCYNKKNLKTNNMKQTAMQEMIKKLEEKRDMWKSDGKLSDRQIRGTYVIAILIAKELLEMEKQQGYSEEDLKEAFSMGRLNKSIKDFNQRFKNK